ncbi:MAG TPA: hypothetical protein VGH38_13690, partial [Bryobacteraceae bacterium]
IPENYTLHINLAMAYGNLGRETESVEHLKRAIEVAPTAAAPRLFYARWLKYKGRIQECQAELETAMRANRVYFPVRDLLMEIYAQQQNQAALDRLARETLELYPGDETAQAYVDRVNGVSTGSPKSARQDALWSH